MKRIALAIEKFSRYAGGAEAYAVDLASRMVREGWEVHVYGQAWDGVPVEVIFHKVRVPRWQPSWAQMLHFAFAHRRMTAGQNFDVILGFGNTIRMNVYQSHGGVHWLTTLRKTYSEPDPRRRAVKRLMVRLSLKQWVRHWIESAPFRQADLPRIIAISQMIKKDMIDFYGVNASEISVVYNGVDTERFNPGIRHGRRGTLRKQYGIAPDETVFLFVSYDLKKKGILPLVEAAAILKRRSGRPFRILVAGGLPWGRLKRRIAELGLEKTLVFAGRVKDMDLCYAGSDVLVLPTYYDACSLAVIEAMACGLPSITTEFNGAAGIMTEGLDGFVVGHPPEPIELFEKMRLLLDPGIYTAMSESAAKNGKQYNSQKSYGAMLDIFDAVARN